MVLVLALLLTALCGVHSASIPANSIGKLARKSANKLDLPILDKIRRTMLDDMKKLLDNQLAVLFDSAVDQKAGAQRKLLKPKTKFHPTLSTGDTTSNLESLLPDESQNSGLIKVLTDGSLQDSGDEVLRNAVDQLLQEDEDKTVDIIDSGEELLYKNEDQLNGDNSTKNNSREIIDEGAFFDGTLPPINTNEKDRQRGKSNSRKDISRVIIEHVPKTNKKYNDDKRSERILDLDEILKSALKDISISLSHEDEYSYADNEDSVLATENQYPKSNQQNESNFQVEGINNEDNDENTLKIGNDNNDLDEKNDNGKLETRLDSVIDHVNSKTKHHKHTHKYSRNHKDHQPINYNDMSENHTNNRYDIHRGENDLNKDENDTKESKREENEDELRKHHNERHSNEKLKKRYGHSRDHHSKKHHSKHRHNKNHDKHKHHNDNENHDHVANQHIIVRLISDSDGNNDSRLDTTHYKYPSHDRDVEKNGRHQNSKETSNHSDRNDFSTSLREDTVNFASEDKSTLAEIKKADVNEEKNNDFEPNNNFTKEDEFISEDNDYIKGKNVTKEESNGIDDAKQVAREENDSLETSESKKENNINNEDDIGKEGNENENYVTDDIENITMENKAREETSDTEAKTRNADENDSENDKKVNTKEAENSKRDEIHECHHERDERIKFESGDPSVIRDLIQNKEMKKSYSLSLTLSTK